MVEQHTYAMILMASNFERFSFDFGFEKHCHFQPYLPKPNFNLAATGGEVGIHPPAPTKNALRSV